MRDQGFIHTQSRVRPIVVRDASEIVAKLANYHVSEAAGAAEVITRM
jgi:hypothetical protein